MPQDPVMLLSFVNTQLRDNYASLEDLCAAYQVDRVWVEDQLRQLDYEYDSKQNRFL